MGQQQAQQFLLLIILGVIVVGIAVAVGITMFEDNARDANRDAVATDLANLAERAQRYYQRPAALGGGEGSFQELTISQLTSRPTNHNGSYALAVDETATKCTIVGTGIETGDDRMNSVQVSVVVYADSMTFTLHN